MLFFDQVVYKINPELDEKYAKYISITLGLIFGVGAFFFGGSGQPYLLDEYN
ncbi:hypothetical protein [Arcobacter sp. CECT 8983]|uniref:hypothetical protein n=1 Tax=Arcobacter sp. CECT 8983 TaxID=2044508 RepID=UPI0013E994C7|nr:hypothetical protein [Arcobacter sp. CECT 8983]